MMLQRQILRASRATSLRSMTAVGLRASGIRFISTHKADFDDEKAIITAQRKNRPLSPDLAIYAPQLTWYLSGLHRLTGIACSGILYAGLISYVALPMVGIPVTAAGAAAVFGGLPLAVKVLAKFILAAPLTFHSWNGIRHLLWDAGNYLTIPGVYKTGYTVLGLTALSTLALVFL